VSAVRLAIRRADLVFAMSPRDLPGLQRLRGDAFAAGHTVLLPPAVDLRPFAASAAARGAARATVADCFPAGRGPVCLTVAMMRVADKLDSYRLLAEALDRLLADRAAPPWRLLVVGDGPARPEVERALAPLPADRVRLLGAVEAEALPAYYLGADLFAFPGLGEDAGLVYLEAAAAGLPIAACQGPGPSYMVAPGGGLLTPPTAEAFAGALRTLLAEPDHRRRLGGAGRRFVETDRSLEAFRERLRDGFSRVGLP
jgi:glycosyltransferase involved in cell wall biosynthesis